MTTFILTFNNYLSTLLTCAHETREDVLQPSLSACEHRSSLIRARRRSIERVSSFQSNPAELNGNTRKSISDHASDFGLVSPSPEIPGVNGKQTLFGTGLPLPLGRGDSLNRINHSHRSRPSQGG